MRCTGNLVDGSVVHDFLQSRPFLGPVVGLGVIGEFGFQEIHGGSVFGQLAPDMIRFVRERPERRVGLHGDDTDDHGEQDDVQANNSVRGEVEVDDAEDDESDDKEHAGDEDGVGQVADGHRRVGGGLDTVERDGVGCDAVLQELELLFVGNHDWSLRSVKIC